MNSGKIICPPKPVLLEALRGDLVDEGIVVAPHRHVATFLTVGRLAPPPVPAILPFQAVSIPKFGEILFQCNILDLSV